MKVKINKKPIRMYISQNCYTIEEFSHGANLDFKTVKDILINGTRVELEDVIKISRFMKVNLYSLIS